MLSRNISITIMIRENNLYKTHLNITHRLVDKKYNLLHNSTRFLLYNE